MRYWDHVTQCGSEGRVEDLRTARNSARFLSPEEQDFFYPVICRHTSCQNNFFPDKAQNGRNSFKKTYGWIQT